MALTPEDVVNKRFQPTKFREGYDQDEVDDFLDEVVVELRRLGQENEELRQRLIASDARINELQRSGGQSAPAPAFAAAPAPAAPAPVAEPVPAAVPAAPVYSAPAVDANPLDPNNTNNLLQLARRLHEEHVREGVEKRDALIAEGQAQAERLQQEAEQAVRQRQQEFEATVGARQQELELQARTRLGALEQERTQLEGEVEQLRTFEREYRAKLKGYIESQLRELDDAGSTPAPAAAAEPEAPSFDAPSYPAPSYAAPAAPQQAAPATPPSFLGFAQN